jgi:hypothetical protein
MARIPAMAILTAESGLTHYFEQIRRFPMLGLDHLGPKPMPGHVDDIVDSTQGAIAAVGRLPSRRYELRELRMSSLGASPARGHYPLVTIRKCRFGAGLR